MRPTTLCAAAAGLCLLASAAAADQVVADDLIVQGSQCVGSDCVDGEAFSFDTIRLKGPVLRIQFTDTSSTGSFPTTDWQITANDDDAGGTASHFSIEDLDAGTMPFTLESGAPSDSIHVTSTGQVGLGTATPTPGVMLDVIGSVKADAVEVTGAVTNGAKAGIVPGSTFVDGAASVSFAAPFAGDYTVVLTAVTDKPSRSFEPSLLAQDANGFTLSAGKKSVKGLVEIHWIAQAVGE